MRYYYIYNSLTRRDLLSKSYIINSIQLPFIKNIILSTINSNTLKNKLKIIEPLFCLELITMSKPILIKSKKSIAAFSLRKNLYIGSYVTLNKLFFFSFLDYFIHFTLARYKYIKYFYSSSYSNSFNINFFLSNFNFFSEIEFEFNKLHFQYGFYLTINLFSFSISLNRLLFSHFLFF
jgi:large subunit ribosomal protein L5